MSLSTDAFTSLDGRYAISMTSAKVRAVGIAVVAMSALLAPIATSAASSTPYDQHKRTR